jgi:hypothetical protein
VYTKLEAAVQNNTNTTTTTIATTTTTTTTNSKKNNRLERMVLYLLAHAGQGVAARVGEVGGCGLYYYY